MSDVYVYTSTWLGISQVFIVFGTKFQWLTSVSRSRDNYVLFFEFFMIFKW